MAIQRAAALPAPAAEITQARMTLARNFGGLVWEGPERRVLLVRVPRAQPDPVNDVEAAVEYLRADDTRDITHCLLIGDEAVAQVYARPLQELMRQREAFDRRTAAAWRQQLPGTLAHVLFQSPEDPRRRWRLAARIPATSVAELDEAMLEELADGIGPELDTPRMKQVCAVYLIASQDDVRLEADMFIEQMRAAWEDEDRRRRAELAAAQQRDAQRRKKEEERRRIVAEMERRLAKQTLAPRSAARRLVDATRRADDLPRAPAGRRTAAGAGTPTGREPDGGPTAAAAGGARRGSAIDAHRSDDTWPTPRNGTPVDTWPAPHDTPVDTWPASQNGTPVDMPATRGSPARAARSQAPLAEATATIIARRRDPGPAGPWMPDGGLGELIDQAQVQEEEQAAAVDKLDELRARVDRAMQAAPASPSTRRVRGPGREVRWAVDQKLGVPGAKGRRTDVARVQTAGAGRSVAEATRAGTARDPAATGHAPDPGVGRPTFGQDGDEPSFAARQVRPAPPSPRLAPARRFLEAAGFDVIESPSTAHAIDLAGERPEGDLQRIVVRVVQRMDPAVAKDLLKTARELDVDLVLCIADAVDPEGKRLLVATKIKVVAPGDLESLKL